MSDSGDLDGIVDLTLAACSTYGRPDLVDAIQRAASTGPPYVLVAGEFKQGKSSLVNACTVEGLCPAPPADATAVPTVVHFGGAFGATAVRSDGTVVQCSPTDLADLVLDTSPGSHDLERVEVRLGAEDDSLVLVDAPGAGGWSSRLGARALGWLPLALATIVCHDGGSPITTAELELVRTAAALCPSVAVVITRIDLHPAWREVEEHARRELDALGLDAVEVLPFSARLAVDPEPLAQSRSGVGLLLKWIVWATASTDREARLLTRCRTAVDELAAAFDVEREALLAEDGLTEEAPPAPDRPLLPWQTVLADGVSDLGGEIDGRWRSALKALTEEADERLEHIDPLREWEPFESWLRNASTAAAIDAFSRLQQGLGALGGDVARAIGDDDTWASGEGRDGAARLGELDLELRLAAAAGLGSRTLAALRSSYSGMMMAGMLTGVAGLTLAGPALLVFGLAMAGKGTRDDRRKQREQRQQQARQTARRYLDELSHLVGQELRETLRVGQRQLRDAALARSAALDAERRRRVDAAAQGAAGRERRLADVEAEQARLARLAARLDDLLAARQGGA